MTQLPDSPSFTGALTPSLLLDVPQMQRNIARMGKRLQAHDVVVRPHVKTAKSLPVIEQMVSGDMGARLTVSTLAEARAVLAAGYRDVLYAVGVVPGKLQALGDMLGEQPAGQPAGKNVQVAVILDSVEMAQALVAYVRLNPADSGWLAAFIELDVDEHRAGVAPGGELLMAIAAELAVFTERDLLRGVMTHAGGAYDCLDPAALVDMAERERAGAVLAAQRLRGAGHECPEVSIGSTPTVTVARSFAGVTEVRVGVYVFNDLVMAGLGVCAPDEIALSVLTSVIGHQPARQTLLVDAGWMALSSDRSTSNHAVDYGLGLVVGEDSGAVEESNLVVVSANQEHGLIQRVDGGEINFANFPLGSVLRILPVHACATAAQYTAYRLLDTESVHWPRFGGW